LETGSPLSITGKHPDGTVVKGAFSEFAYLLEDGKKRWFPSPQIFLSWGYKWSQIVTIPEQELAGYPSGPDITAQSSFYLQDIQDAISVNLRDEEVPAGGIFSKLPQLFDSFSSKKHVKELPGVNRGRRVLKTVF